MRWTSVFSLLMLASAPLAAQQPGRMGRDPEMMGHMTQMQQMMAPMMRAMAFTPDHLLARKDSLNLTPQQVTRLTGIRDASKTTHDAAAADAKPHMDAMMQALTGKEPDTAAMKAHFQAAHESMEKAHWAMLAAAAQSRAVLTAEQRARVERWANTMMGHAMEHH